MFSSYLGFIKTSLGMLFKGNIGSFGDYLYAVLGLMALLLSFAGVLLFIYVIILGPVRSYQWIKSITDEKREKLMKISRARKVYTKEEEDRIVELKERLVESNKEKNNELSNSIRKELCELDDIKHKRGYYTDEENQELAGIYKEEKRNLIIYIGSFILIYIPIVFPIILMSFDWVFSI